MLSLENKKVLLVEDDDMNFIYLKQIFKITKGELIRAKSGAQAVEFFGESDYDCVLMDLKLPDMSGIEVIEIIRQQNLNVPIILQTASKSSTDYKEALAAGCNSILIKPFKMEEFISAVESLV